MTSIQGGPFHVSFFADGPEGRTTITVVEGWSKPAEAFSGTVTLTLRAGHEFGINFLDGAASDLDGTIKVTTLATTPSLHVSALAPAGVTLSSKGATVAGGARPGFVVTAPDGVTLPAIPGGTCPPGSWDGPRYTAGAVSADCTIDFGAAGSPGPGDSGGGSTPGDQPNQAPTLALGQDFALDTDPRFYTGLGWARVSPGPASEAGQKLSAQLAVTGTTGTLAFDTLPTLDVATGNLSFAAKLGTSGTATVTVTLKDDGGTANGGTDTTTGVFTIQVNSPPKGRDISVKGTGVLCLPITIIADDVDLHASSVDDGDRLNWRLLSLPKNGFLMAGLDGEYFSSDPEGWSLLVAGTSQPGTRAEAMCYLPFSSSYSGLDSFTYAVKDVHGGFSGVAIVNIEVIKPF